MQHVKGRMFRRYSETFGNVSQPLIFAPEC